MRHAGEDQPRLFPSGDHFDRKAERLTGALDELRGVFGHAQSIGCYYAHLMLTEPFEVSGKLRQRHQSALLRSRINHLAGIEAGRKPDVDAQ